MCHLRYKLRMFLFCRKVIFCSQDIQVFVFLTIPWFTKHVMSWWVLVHDTGFIFEYIFWTTTHKVNKIGQLIDISQGNNFHKSFEQFGGLGLHSRFYFTKSELHCERFVALLNSSIKVLLCIIKLWKHLWKINLIKGLLYMIGI